MAKSSKEAIVIVLDIGLSASHHMFEDGASFLEKSKTCIERIIERKIFASANDEIGLVLLGTETTANALRYANISEGFRMANPSWEMLKTIKEIKGTKIDKCDWIDALVVAMNVLQTQIEEMKISCKKIVLFVDPDNDVSNDKLDIITNGLQKLEIELTAIGVDLFPEGEKPEREEMEHDGANERNGIEEVNGKSRKEKGETLLSHIITESEGISCNFSDAISQLKNYQIKAVRPTPWNVTLDIGENIQIPVALFKKISPVTLPSWEKAARQVPEKRSDASTSQSHVLSEGGLVDQERVYMREDRTVVDKEDRIAGYFFGSTAVPFNEYDNEQLKYKSGEKCLNILGFARRSDVQRKYFIGEGCYYLVPQKKHPAAQQCLAAFIQALHDQEKVAIATKVFRKDASPRLVVLFPLQKKKYKCILLVELPFSEDVNEFVFPRVVPDKDEPNDEQLAAVDNLMDTMDLTNIQREDGQIEAFRLKDTIDPGLVHQFRRMAHRAMYPDEPVPVFEDIKAMLSCPFQSNANYKIALDVVKDKFALVEQPEMSSAESMLHQNKKKALKKEMFDPQPSTSKDAIDTAGVEDVGEITMDHNILVEVGTTKPHEDFNNLVAKGLRFKTVCEQMQKVIMKIVLSSFGSESFPKALQALTALRKSCVEKDPIIYNEWLPNFKKTLDERDRLNFWELIGKDGLGLISSEETPLSSISKEDTLALFRDTEEEQPEIRNEELDVDDLIDEM